VLSENIIIKKNSIFAKNAIAFVSCYTKHDPSSLTWQLLTTNHAPNQN